MSFLSSNLINRLLCSTLRLKELYVFGSNGSGDDNWLDVQECCGPIGFARISRSFACPIEGIPRPAITRDIVGQHPDTYVIKSTPQESTDIQHQIYAKLASFTVLQELKLDFPLCIDEEEYQSGDKERYRQYDRLAMDLDSGLDLMKGLRGLRVVSL